MKKSTLFKVLVIALLSALCCDTSAQSDTCYTKEQNRRIAEKLIEGDNWKKSYHELKEIYDVQTRANEVRNELFNDQTRVIENKTEENKVLEKKVKRRNRWIIVLGLLVVGSQIG